MDDAIKLAAAQKDSQAFIAGLNVPNIPDEAPRVPALAPAIHSAVDAVLKPGCHLRVETERIAVPLIFTAPFAGRFEIRERRPLQGAIGPAPANIPLVRSSTPDCRSSAPSGDNGLRFTSPLMPSPHSSSPRALAVPLILTRSLYSAGC